MKRVDVEVAAIVSLEMEQGSHAALLAFDILDTIPDWIAVMKIDLRPVQRCTSTVSKAEN
jgi:hypothetical protein